MESEDREYTQATRDLSEAVEQAHQARRDLAKILEDARNLVLSLEEQEAAAQSRIQANQASVAEKSAHIQAALEHAQATTTESSQLLQRLTSLVASSEKLASAADVAVDDCRAARDEIDESRRAFEAARASAAAEVEAARTSAATCKSLADRAQAIESRISNYETRLEELQQEAAARLNEIHGLLPGATATGLAHAFDVRRQTFIDPVKKWQYLFVGALVALVILALTGLYATNGVAQSWDELVRHWLARLPIAGALVWLALHASREAALGKRLEEDYGYKAAIAASFLGFQRQMSELEAIASVDSPLGRLCQDTLTTIGSPPGRIYSSQNLTVTPASEIANAATSAVGGLVRPDKGLAGPNT